MRDHYEVLELENNASDDDIKKAYRKMALKWHPDKNVGNETATSIFQEIQQAHAVLSNPHERQWYDDHKEAILRGDDNESTGTSSGINIWPYFSSSCFSGYNESKENNFYAVYGKLFKTLDEEEEDQEWENEYHETVPLLGNSQSSFTDITKFYNYWKNFVTKKPFTEADKYNPNTALNRQMRRAMEAENKKARTKAKKEFNEKIKHLAEVCKRFDRRYTLLQKKERERKEAEKKEKEEQKKKMEAERLTKKLELMKERSKMVDDFDYEMFEDYLSNSESEEEEISEHYCPVCKKGFKSQNQWENHEKSKKHKENVENMRDQLIFSDEEFDEENEGSFEDEAIENYSDESFENYTDEEIEEETKVLSKSELKKLKKKRQKQNKKNVNFGIEEFEINNLNIQDSEEDENSDDNKNTVDNEDIENIENIEGKEINEEFLEENKSEFEISENEKNEDIPYISKAKAKQLRKKQLNQQKKNQRQKNNNLNNNDEEEEKNVNNMFEIDLEKEKELDLKEQNSKTNNKKGKRRANNQNNEELACVSCKTQFQTRNALFKHLKKTGHQKAL